MSALRGFRWRACPECLRSIVKIEEGFDVSSACRDADRSEVLPDAMLSMKLPRANPPGFFSIGFPGGALEKRTVSHRRSPPSAARLHFRRV